MTDAHPSIEAATRRETKGLPFVQIYQFHDAETGQTYCWNATEGRRLAKARRADTVTVHPADFGIDVPTIRQMYPDLDEKKAEALPEAALRSPLLFIEHRGKHVLIDGWHRLFRAVSHGEACLPAYILTQEEADRIRITEPIPF